MCINFTEPVSFLYVVFGRLPHNLALRSMSMTLFVTEQDARASGLGYTSDKFGNQKAAKKRAQKSRRRKKKQNK